MKALNGKTIKTMAVILSVSIIAVLCFFGTRLLNKKDEEQKPVDNRPVIYSDSFDLYIQTYNAMIPPKAVYISPELTEKLEKYKGQDVLFKVIVQYPYLVEYENEYELPKEYTDGIKDLENQIQATQQKIKELKAINTDKMTEDEKRLHRAELIQSQAKVPLLERELEKLERQDTHGYWLSYVQEVIEREKNFAYEAGAKNVKKFEGHSEIYKDELRNPYIMELTADTIAKMTERKTCVISLMSKERIGNYKKNITDTLTQRLEKMGDDETIEVAVVSKADDKNLFAYEQGLTDNRSYNGENPYKDWEKFIKKDATWNQRSFDGAIENYITDIIERNGIADKRIMSDELPKNGLSTNISAWDAEYFSEFNIAGFNAKLTKTEIINLAKDKDIKAIYLATEKNIIKINFWGDKICY